MMGILFMFHVLVVSFVVGLVGVGRTMDMLFPGFDTQNTTMFLRKIHYIIDVEWLYPFF